MRVYLALMYATPSDWLKREVGHSRSVWVTLTKAPARRLAVLARTHEDRVRPAVEWLEANNLIERFERPRSREWRVRLRVPVGGALNG